MKRSRESGYAVLLIFLMAGMLALALYTAIPRVAFEAQRDQEQLLIDRGEQYKRALQLFYRKTRRYPAKLEDLDNLNGQRFLRQHYADPMTGKTEWRLIHVGAGGVLLDSLTQKNNSTKKQDPGSVNTFITELAPVGGGGPVLNGPTVGVGQRRRPSDQQGDAAGGDPNLGPPGGNVPGLNPDGTPIPPTGNDGQPVAAVPVPPTPGFPGQPGQIPPGAVPGVIVNYPTGRVGGFPTPAPGNVQQVPGVVPGVTFGQIPRQVPGQPTVPDPNQPNTNNGLNVIQGLLTRPRPGGPPVTTDPGNPGAVGAPVPDPNAGSTSTVNVGVPAGTTGSSSGGVFSSSSSALPSGGGIAGVASTVERQGIKSYNQHSKYNEWEFIYDFAKEMALGGRINQVANPINGGQQNGLQQQGIGPGNPNPGSGNPASNLNIPVPPPTTQR